MRGRKKRNLIIGVLCCLLVFMGVGFAALNITLNINGTATAINTWDVRMKSITVSTKSNGVENNETDTKILEDGETANVFVSFEKPGDNVTYEVLIENNGTLDATLGELLINLSSTNASDKELFLIDNTFPENKKIRAGESLTFTITISFDANATEMPAGEVKFDIKLDAFQGDIKPEDIKPDATWDFEVNDSGTIIAYNYELGTNVVIPATNYEGKPIKAINARSFTGNSDAYYNAIADVYVDNETGELFVIIEADEPHFSVVKSKLLSYVKYECQSNGSQEEIDACMDESESFKFYKYGEVDLAGSIKYMTVYVNTDPSKPWQESLEMGFVLAQLSNNKKIKSINPETLKTQKTITASKINNSTVLLTSLDLSKATNLKTIGSDSFKNMNLSKIIFGNNSSVSLIGKNAFYGNKIQSLSLPGSITKIDINAFSNNPLTTLTIEKCSSTVCTPTVFGNSLKEVTVNSGEIGALAFVKSPVEKVKIGSGVTKIGESSFVNGNLLVSSLETAVLIDEEKYDEICTSFECYNSDGERTLYKLSEIPYEVVDWSNIFVVNYDLEKDYTDDPLVELINLLYSGYSSVKQLDLSKASNLEVIGRQAFQGVQLNSQLVLPDSLKVIGDLAFFNALITGKLVIPDGVNVIGDSSFYATQINDLVLGSGVTKIGKGAFASSQIIGELVIPSNVIEIGSSAFEATQINSLYFPKTVAIVGSSAFEDNYFDSLIIENCTESICKSDRVLNLPTGTFITSSYAFNSYIDNLTIQSGIIQSSAFINGHIKSLTIGSGVTSIGTGAFNLQRDSNNNPLLESVFVERTEEDFLANVTVANSWFDTSLVAKPTFK